MKPASAKAKGRRLANYVKDKLLEILCTLEEDDIQVTSSGATGEDLKFSPRARALFPFSVECKSRHSISVYTWLEQAEKNNKKGAKPIVVAKENNNKPIAFLYLSDFLDIIKDYNAAKESKCDCR